MNRKFKLRVCDWLLTVAMVLILASGIQLEALYGESVLWIWIHIVLGIIFSSLITWHLQSHFQWRNWLRLLWKQKSTNTKWLTATVILTLVSAIICTIGWLASPEHSKIGAIHGKFGFILIALSIWHTARRLKSLVATRSIQSH